MKNFGVPLKGPCQTVSRAELAGAEGVLAQEHRPLRLRIDNLWVVSGLQLLVEGCVPGPLREHLDLWLRCARLIEDRVCSLEVVWVKGHLTEELIRQGKEVRKEAMHV